MTDLKQAAQQAEPCVGKDPRCPCLDGDACHYKDCVGTKARPVPQAEPTPWRDMVVVTLVREGIDKHRARELADHFAAQPEPPSEWPLIKNILAEYGLDAIAFVAEWKAAQRPWQGLTPEEILDLFDVNNVYGSKWIEFARTVEAKLKEKNGH